MSRKPKYTNTRSVRIHTYTHIERGVVNHVKNYFSKFRLDQKIKSSTPFLRSSSQSFNFGRSKESTVELTGLPRVESGTKGKGRTSTLLTKAGGALSVVSSPGHSPFLRPKPGPREEEVDLLEPVQYSGETRKSRRCTLYADTAGTS